jgi:flagellar basal-body rod protein FlgG
MLRAIDLSRAGMLRQGQFMESIVTNITGINTKGYKAIRAALETGELAPTDDVNGTGTDVPALPTSLKISRLFTQGEIQPSDKFTDLAINGDGFFIVESPDGTVGYTRSGSFGTDEQGRLIDAAGNLLQPGITVPRDTSSIKINDDGSVTAMLEGGGQVAAGQIRLARFMNPNGLFTNGGGMYAASAASGPAQTFVPGEGGSGTVVSGALEASNADFASQMSNLMAAQRAYQLNTSSFRMSDEMLRMAGTLQGNQ